jgi:hypothetical protein
VSSRESPSRSRPPHPRAAMSASGERDKTCGKARLKAARGQPHSMRIPTPRRAAGVQWQQYRDLVKDSPNMITHVTTIHAHRLAAPDRTCNMTGTWTSPRTQTSPRSSLATCFPTNPAEGHSLNCGAHHQISRRFGHDLGQTSASPVWRNHPNYSSLSAQVTP